MNTSWNPTQYEKFKNQRAKPFYDLMKLIRKEALTTGVDLGCGTGELTRDLFDELQISELTGIDSSQKMLDKAGAFIKPGLTFERVDIGRYQPKLGLDLVFSNAALQWLPDHEVLMPKILSWVNPGGQIAIQMPQNFDHPSHRIAREVAAGLFPKTFSAKGSPIGTLPFERYAEILFERGFEEQICRVEVYGHPMSSGADVIEWTKGTLLTSYQSQLSEDEFELFLDRYRTELLKVIGTGAYFYAFKRLLIWGKKMKCSNE